VLLILLIHDCKAIEVVVYSCCVCNYIVYIVQLLIENSCIIRRVAFSKHYYVSKHITTVRNVLHCTIFYTSSGLQ